MAAAGGRAAMIDAAEALIAVDGLASVSLRDVQAAAGQRNKSAAQYHFGTRDGLLIAIVEERMSPINAARNARLDALEAGADVRSIVDAFIVPLAEAVSTPDSTYARFLVQVVTDPNAAALVFEHLAASSTRRTQELLEAATPELSADLRDERFARLVLTVATTLAGWEARSLDDTTRALLTSDLLDTAVAMFTAAPSPATERLLSAPR